VILYCIDILQHLYKVDGAFVPVTVIDIFANYVFFRSLELMLQTLLDILVSFVSNHGNR